MKTELLLKFEFVASHSLAGYEAPHPHLWKLETGVSGEPKEGKIVDIILLRQAFQEALTPLQDSFLNENNKVSLAVRRFPTCETLSQYFFERFTSLLESRFAGENPTIRLSSITIGICGMNGVETGAVKLRN